MSVQVDDAEILRKFQDEKTRNEAFNLLLKKYQQKLYWHVRRMVIDHDDADDLIQDTFVKVWKNLPGFRSDAGLKALREMDGPVLFAHSDLSGFSVFEEASWWGYRAAQRALRG